ncbi:MAG: 50S ribosomal protein L11 methyltransferase [Pseudomonadota bacterium]
MNPFTQAPVTYCLELQIQYQYLQDFMQYCETLSDSIVYFEAEDTRTIDSKPEDLWQINIYFDKKPDLKEIEDNFIEIAKICRITTPRLVLASVIDKDWVSEVQKTFAPIEAGKFFIHHSEFEEEIPENLIAIEVNAGRAFGTGEHETTSNCLRVLSRLDVNGKVLDMGCGSGILAIAMAKLGANKVIAVDLDEQAVLVTEENAKLNNSEFCIGKSDGYNSDLVKSNAPYQIITSNILASPLVAMANDASKYLDLDGIIILAGFLKDQRQAVLEAHQKAGLSLIDEICIENWPALVMKK